ncbi:hypothetical protein [Paenibacillus sp. YIM B09110]|uniref:hypothetical protein n=1 Tax=Paenibacillus sp. YIM B09110 TaxID=3126102 RepID=UPI00301CB13F
MKLLRYILYGLLVFFLIEIIYYNVVFDILLVALLFVVSYALGSFFKIKLGPLDNLFIKLSIGLGIVGIFVWLTTFIDIHKKSLFIVLSILVIAKQYKIILNASNKINTIIKLHVRKQPLFLCLFLLILMIYIVPAVYPVWQYDSLSKHVAIATQMSMNAWDYNVVEFIGYGDYAIFSHLLFTFLMSLGGTKALVLLNVSFSFFIYLALIRLSRSVIKTKMLPFLIGIIYFSTPLILNLSTTMYVDIIPVFFIIVALLVVKTLNPSIVYNHLTYMYFILGLSFFSKQFSVYFILPISIVLAVMLILKVGWVKSIVKFSMSFLICISSFFPVLILIWYKTGNPVFPFINSIFKSAYFPVTNFEDPFTHELSFSFKSLFSIVFNTSSNIELENGGLGYILLLLPVAVVASFFIKNKFLYFANYLILASYFLATLMTYNIRYFLGSIVLSIMVCVIAVYIIFRKLLRSNFNNVLQVTVMGALLIINMLFNINPQNYHSIKKSMLAANEEFLKNDNEGILSSINEKGTRLLSNNDVYRGAFLGEFYTLTWYNMIFTDKLSNNEIAPVDFLLSFDYYLVDKRQDLRLSNLFTLEEPEIRKILIEEEETATHILYRVNNTKNVDIITSTYQEPLHVNANNPVVIPFENQYSDYKIDLEIEGDDKGEVGRWQINWMNKSGVMITTSLVPFEVKRGNHHYINIVTDVPKNASSGLLYLNSHTEESIKIHSVKLSANAKTGNHILDQVLERYNRKWPYLYNQ